MEGSCRSVADVEAGGDGKVVDIDKYDEDPEELSEGGRGSCGNR
jgi:hypothetical protein